MTIIDFISNTAFFVPFFSRRLILSRIKRSSMTKTSIMHQNCTCSRQPSESFIHFRCNHLCIMYLPLCISKPCISSTPQSQRGQNHPSLYEDDWMEFGLLFPRHSILGLVLSIQLCTICQRFVARARVLYGFWSWRTGFADNSPIGDSASDERRSFATSRFARHRRKRTKSLLPQRISCRSWWTAELGGYCPIAICVQGKHFDVTCWLSELLINFTVWRQKTLVDAVSKRQPLFTLADNQRDTFGSIAQYEYCMIDNDAIVNDRLLDPMAVSDLKWLDYWLGMINCVWYCMCCSSRGAAQRSRAMAFERNRNFRPRNCWRTWWVSPMPIRAHAWSMNGIFTDLFSFPLSTKLSNMMRQDNRSSIPHRWCWSPSERPTPIWCSLPKSTSARRFATHGRIVASAKWWPLAQPARIFAWRPMEFAMRARPPRIWQLSSFRMYNISTRGNVEISKWAILSRSKIAKFPSDRADSTVLCVEYLPFTRFRSHSEHT